MLAVARTSDQHIQGGGRQGVRYFTSVSIRALPCGLLFILVLALFSPDTTAKASGEQIVIQADTPAENLPSIEALRNLAFGGTTLCGMHPKRFGNLFPLPFSSIRILQFEHAIRPDPDRLGKGMQIPSNIVGMLELCQARNIIPHIVIGNRPPKKYLLEGPDKWTYGPRDWGAYKRFMVEWMSQVLSNYTFPDVVFEVGNEFEIPENHWLMPSKLHIGDPRLYDGYLKLYTELGEVIGELRRRFPNQRITYGGPNFSVYSFYHLSKEKDWVSRFLADVAAHKLPSDYLSLHFYSDQGSAKEIEGVIDLISQEMQSTGLTLPIWLTEWGACSVPWSYGSLINSDERAGTFIFQSADMLARLGVQRALFLCARDFPGQTGPVTNNTVLDSTGSRTATYWAMRELSALKGTRMAYEPHNGLVTTIAVRDGEKLTVILANMSTHHRLTPNEIGMMAAEAPRSVDVVLEDLPDQERWHLTAYRPNGQPWTRQLPALRSSPIGMTVNKLPLPFGHFAVLVFEQQL